MNNPKFFEEELVKEFELEQKLFPYNEEIARVYMEDTKLVDPEFEAKRKEFENELEDNFYSKYGFGYSDNILLLTIL